MTGPNDKIQPNAVEDHGGILTIRGGGAQRDWNGNSLQAGHVTQERGNNKAVSEHRDPTARWRRVCAYSLRTRREYAHTPRHSVGW